MLVSEFQLHPLAIEDAKKRRQRAKLEVYENHLFLTVRAWIGQKQATDDLIDTTEEIDIFLGERYLITVHDNSELTEEIHLNWERFPEEISDGASQLLYFFLDAVVDDFFPAMDVLDSDIDALEMSIYDTAASIDLAPAVSIKKRLLLLRQTI